MSKSLIFLGAGGHAKVLMEIALQQSFDIQSVIAPEKPNGLQFDGVPHFAFDDEICHHSKEAVELVNGLGSLPLQKNRRIELFIRFSALGYSFATVLASTAIVSSHALLNEGVQVLPGAIINGCEIGTNSIINTGAIIEHDVKIGRHCHIAPGAVLCGNVHLEDNVHIGAGATIIQGVSIGKGAVVGAGSVVTKNLMAHSVHYPARSFIQRGMI